MNRIYGDTLESGAGVGGLVTTSEREGGGGAGVEREGE